MEHQATVKTNQPDGKNQSACCAKPVVRLPDSSHMFRELHQRIGNRALGRHIQAKLKVSEPHDAYEQEADRVADQVMRMPDPTTSHEAEVSSRQAVPHIQRMCTDCEEDEAMRKTAGG